MTTHGDNPNDSDGLTSPVLTEAETIRWLRLDVGGPKDPSGTLKYYRQRGLLRAVRIGRHLRYTVPELNAFLGRMAEKSKCE